MTLGQKIDKLEALRVKQRAAAKVHDAIKAEYDATVADIMAELAANDSPKAGTRRATVSLKETVVANIVDFDEAFKFAAKKGYSHLFQRRISDPAFRELLALSKGKGVPGLEPFTKLSLTHTSLKDAA